MRITFIPQDPFTGFNPVFTVGDQIMELMKWKSPRAAAQAGAAGCRLSVALSRRAPAADRDAVAGAARAVQLPEPEQMLRKYPHEFSGGQRQRLMIAMALLPEPDLVIADEPTTALDVTIQAQILGLMRHLANERGVSVLFTTHDLGTAYEICDAVTVMYAGQDVEIRAGRPLLRRPAHPYTRSCSTACRRRRHAPAAFRARCPSLIAPPAAAASIRAASAAAGPCRERARRSTSRRRALGALLSSAPRSRMTRTAPILELARPARSTFPCAAPLGRRTGTIQAVDGVSFDVMPGEVFGLVGESGCGKSTLGKTIVGIHEPTAGEIRFEGQRHRPAGAGRAGAACAAACSTSTRTPGASLDPRWKIGRSLDEPLVIHTRLSRGSARRTHSQHPRAVGLPDTHLDLYPHEMSGGQQRRVGLARILTLHPEVVILDEPTSGLDVSVQATVLRCSAACASLRPHLHVHQPRSLRGPHDVRPRRRDVSRPHRRDRADRGALRPAAAPLYALAAGGHAQDRRRARTTDFRLRASRRPGQPAGGLPLPSALPPCHRALPRQRTGTNGSGAGPTVACHFHG